jgi:predicted outer membrane repeat protein
MSPTATLEAAGTVVGNIDGDPLFVDESASNYRLSQGSPCIDAGDNMAVPPDVSADHDGYGRFIDDADVPDTGSGTPPIVDMGAYEYQAAALHVDDDAPLGGDGSTWDEAMRFLQDALLIADRSVIVKVAGGIYRPDASSAHPDGSGDRETSFILADGVRILGGYAGQGADDPDERDPDLYETMLSGDLNGDDGVDFTNYDDNARHIVVADDTVSRTAVLDGVTIRAGHADGDTADPLVAGGAGLLCDGADLVVRDCRFTANLTGRAGGALYTRDGTPLIVDCLFDGNAGGYGAALNARTGHPRIANCRFLGNTSDWHGGAIANEATLRLANCFFAGNRAALGGGAINMTGHLIMSNCTDRAERSTHLRRRALRWRRRPSDHRKHALLGQRPRRRGR